MDRESVGVLVGMTMSGVERKGDDEIVFTVEGGEKFRLYHDRSCCESVTIEDIIGDLQDLVGSPILKAEESTSGEHPPGIEKEHEEGQDSFTWTFYLFATVKGYVTIRWYGESNGEYSESVDFGRIEELRR